MSLTRWARHRWKHGNYPGGDAALVGDSDHLETALRVSEVFAGLAACLRSLEYLARLDDFDDDGLMGWKIARTTGRLNGRLGDTIDRVISPWVWPWVERATLAGGALLAVSGGRRRGYRCLPAGLAAGLAARSLRSSGGGEGADQVALLTLYGVAIARLVPHDRRARETCLWFIALLSCLSYAASGVAKLVSPTWRDGTALHGILRTRTFGHHVAHRALRRFPRLAKYASRSVITGETAFPAVLVAPAPVAWALLGMAASFHTGTAVIMGLNRFVWAYIGTYPAIAYCARSLPPRSTGSPAGRPRDDSLSKLFLAGAVLLAGGRALSAAAVRRRSRRHFPPPGRLVDVGTHRVHVLTDGRGDEEPAVVFVNGLGLSHLHWSWVQPAVARSGSTTTVCYDRSGTGWSDSGPPLRVPDQFIGELAAVIAHVDAERFVFVGHSLGGALVRAFAARFPELVAGMVLVESADPAELSETDEELVWMEEHLRTGPSWAALGLLPRVVRSDDQAAGLPADVAAAACFLQLSAEPWRRAYAELRLWRAGLGEQVRRCGDIGALPLVVLTAGGGAAGLDHTDLERQRTLAKLSSNSIHVIVEGAEHISIIADERHAAVVAEAITAVVEAARSQTTVAEALASTSSSTEPERYQAHHEPAAGNGDLESE